MQTKVHFQINIIRIFLINDHYVDARSGSTEPQQGRLTRMYEASVAGRHLLGNVITPQTSQAVKLALRSTVYHVHDWNY